MALNAVKVIYETIGTQHVIKKVEGSEVPNSELQAAVDAITGWDGYASIAAAQLTSYDKPNELLGLEAYQVASVWHVRSVVANNAYKVAERRPAARRLLKQQVLRPGWGILFHLENDEATNGVNFLRKLLAVITVDSVLSSDTNYAILTSELEIDIIQWVHKHSAETWAVQLGAEDLNWYRTDQTTDTSNWQPVQVTGVSVAAGWIDKHLLEELD